MAQVPPTQPQQASSTAYEVALFGEFQHKELTAIMNRFTLHSESSRTMHLREVLLEPLDAQYQRENKQEPIMLRAQKDVNHPEAGW
jgi:mediator of RNA polymerase II transcription subunit 18